MGVSNPDSPSIWSLVERLRVQTGNVYCYRLIEILQDLDCRFFTTLLQLESKNILGYQDKVRAKIIKNNKKGQK